MRECGCDAVEWCSRHAEEEREQQIALRTGATSLMNTPTFIEWLDRELEGATTQRGIRELRSALATALARLGEGLA